LITSPFEPPAIPVDLFIRRVVYYFPNKASLVLFAGKRFAAAAYFYCVKFDLYVIMFCNAAKTEEKSGAASTARDNFKRLVSEYFSRRRSTALIADFTGYEQYYTTR
jgi:hypothetical protein